MVSGALPPGLGYDAATLTLSGTPTTAGAFTVGFRVTDSASHSMEQSFTLRVGSLNTIASPYRLADAPLGVPYVVQLTATGQAPLTWYAGPPSNLPPGLVLSSSGLISGTPTTQSYYNFAVRALDASGRLAIKTLSINITNPMAFATTAVPVAAVLESYTYCLAANGGQGTLTYDVSSGVLPPGVTLQTNGCFTGPPTSVGDFGFTARLTDQSQVASRSFAIDGSKVPSGAMNARTVAASSS